MIKVLKIWLPLVVAITLLSGLIYVVIQQDYRQNANDPEVQITEDISQILESGEDPAALNQQNQSDISKTLSLFLVVYGEDGKAIAGNGMLDGKLPEIPKGVLDAAKNKTDSRVTWEPKKGLRFAAVVRHYGGSKPGFIVAARSLREVEKRVDMLIKMVGLGWLITLLASLIATALSKGFRPIWDRLRKKDHKAAETPALTEETK